MGIHFISQDMKYFYWAGIPEGESSLCAEVTLRSTSKPLPGWLAKANNECKKIVRTGLKEAGLQNPVLWVGLRRQKGSYRNRIRGWLVWVRPKVGPSPSYQSPKVFINQSVDPAGIRGKRMSLPGFQNDF